MRVSKVLDKSVQHSVTLLHVTECTVLSIVAMPLWDAETKELNIEACIT